MANTGHIMTLANSIIGVGILAMPFCFQKCGVILSIVLLVLSNLITRISCHYLLKSSMLTRRKSFEFLAFHAFGPSGKLLVELCIIGYLIGTCITYFVVVGDVGPQITAKVLNVSESDNLRIWVMLFVTIFCIIPLALLKNVDSLAAVCTASIGFYFCLVLKVISESKTHIFNGYWMDHIEYWKPSGILQCLPIFSMALACQMQLFEVLEITANASLEKLNEIVKIATGICTSVYIFVGFFGYVAFCNQHFSGNILVNFSPSFISDAIKMGFVLSVAFSFPLAIFPCRASIYSLIYRRGHSDSSGYIPENRFKTITVAIAAFSLLIGLLIPSIELVIGLVGSTIGVVICIMFPASCFMKIFKKDSTEKQLAQVIFICGCCLMILGTYANLNAIDEKRSGPSIEDAIKPVDIIKPFENFSEQNLKLKENLVNEIPLVAQETQEKEKLANDIRPKIPSKKKNIMILKESMRAKEEKENLKPDQKIILPKEDVIPKKTDDIPKEAEKPSEEKIEKNIEINKDAIKKEDEVAAEESKKEVAEIKKDVAEIKEAESELKKTKELFEKQVIELKEEFAKQNKETQNLVAERLGNIAEKVDKIEQKVIKDLQPNHEDKPIEVNLEETKPKVEKTKTEPKPVDNVQKEDKDVPNNGPILAVLTENIKQNESKLPVEEIKAAVYEPMSYKVGEVMNKVHDSKNNSETKDLPPIPLLLHATMPKNETIKNEKSIKNEENTVDEKKTSKENENFGNIEAIRRDILGAVTSKDDSGNKDLNVIREKRNADKFCVNWDIERDNCLDDTVPGNLLPQNVDLKVQSFGRDLKSVDEKL